MEFQVLEIHTFLCFLRKYCVKVTNVWFLSYAWKLENYSVIIRHITKKIETSYVVWPLHDQIVLTILRLLDKSIGFLKDTRLERSVEWQQCRMLPCENLTLWRTAYSKTILCLLTKPFSRSDTFRSVLTRLLMWWGQLWGIRPYHCTTASNVTSKQWSEEEDSLVFQPQAIPDTTIKGGN